MLIEFLVTALCVLQQSMVKAELNIVLEDITIAKLDTQYIDPNKTEAYIVDDSRGGSISMKMTFVKMLPLESQGRMRIFGLSMGEYKISSGVDVKMKLCDFLDEPLFVAPFLAVLGMTRETCPPPPGTYIREGYHLAPEAFPEDFQENQYVAILQVQAENKLLMEIKIFGDVKSI